MTLGSGRTLSHYRLLEPLGEGGMGVVWRATDTTLGRSVAVKVLPDSFANDPERLARFEREARVLASLNHPHIASIFGFHAADHTHFLAMELVEGEDLSERLARGPIALGEALPIALQIVEALEHAHERGIVHRDLKPANVKLSGDGRIKVLDFGLAKALEGEIDSGSSPSLLSRSPTITGNLTSANVLLGTAAYMSPEQARGRKADRRADIWSFGVLFMEMLTGRRVFEGETISDTLASVLKSEPDWTALPSETPHRIRRLLRRCLDRDPRRRLQDIGEARVVLEDAIAKAPEEAVPEIAAAMPPRPGRAAILVGCAVGGFTLGALVAFGVLRGMAPEREAVPHRRFTLSSAAADAMIVTPAISPDGSTVVYFADGNLWAQKMDGSKAREIPVEAGAQHAFWSPDGTRIGYFAGSRIFTVSPAGGESQLVCNTGRGFGGGTGGSWTKRGTIVYSHGDSLGLEEVSASGGDPHVVIPLEPPGELDFHEPAALPDGRGLVFVVHGKGGIDTISLSSGGKRKVLLHLPGQSFSNPQYSPTGHILFRRASTTPGVWALPFSLSRLEATGEPFLVTPDARSPSVALDGTLALIEGSSQPKQLVWMNRAGEEIGAVGAPKEATPDFDVTPDGLRVLRVEVDANGNEIWVYDVSRQTRTRLTFSDAIEEFPRWSPSGDRITYTSRTPGCGSIACWSVLVAPADASGRADTVAGSAFDSRFTPDGKHLIYSALPSYASWDLTMAAVDGERNPKTLVRGNPHAEDGAVSPQGDLMAYMSDESGEWEIFLTRFPSIEGKWQVSVAGGQHPHWNASGDRLTFVQADDMMEVPIGRQGGRPVLGTPVRLFSRRLGLGPWGWYRSFAMAADGSPLLVERAVGDRTRPVGITIVQNWFAEFETRK